VLVGGILSAAGTGAQEPSVPPRAPEAVLAPVTVTALLHAGLIFGGIAYRF
jgi:hypothetical protein